MPLEDGSFPVGGEIHDWANAFRMMLKLIPEWNFGLGFATLGMVHVTQYLAIVWKYNRGLAARPNRARVGWFRSSFARGGLIVASVYVIVCLTYGFFVSGEGAVAIALCARYVVQLDVIPWIVGTMLAVGFTSTLMHYYYDGFIWKMRHRLELEEAMLQIRPRAVTYEKVGELTYLRAKAKRLLWAHDDNAIDVERDLLGAVRALEQALECPATSTDETWRAEVEKNVVAWRAGLDEYQAASMVRRTLAY